MDEPIKHKELQDRIKQLERENQQLRQIAQFRSELLSKSELQISEQKQAESQMLSEQAFRKSIESALSSGIAVVDDEGRQTYVNPSFCKLFGWTKEELEGTFAPFVYWPADQLQFISEAFQLTISGKAPKEGFELEFVNKDGIRIPSQVIISPFYDGTNRIGWLANVNDITERKHIEEALQESQLRLSEAHKLAHIGIWDWEANTDTVIWSEELYLISGLDPTLPAPSYAEHAALYTPESWKILSAFVKKALETGESYHAELELIRPDGHIRHVNAFGGAKQDAKGQIIGLFGTLQDITNRKLADEKIRKLLEEKETLLHEVHHRVKNNLQVIIALIKMRTRSTKHAGTIKFLKELENQVHSMALVYEQLYQSENLKQVGMTKYLRLLTANVLDTYGRRDAIRFHLDAPLSLDVALATPCGLIVNELFSNILKHAFPPGFRGKPTVSIIMRQDDETFHLTVIDNGIGFPPGYDWRKSHSMGLNLVKLWVEHQLGGTIAVSGKSGTTFTVTFNLKD